MTGQQQQNVSVANATPPTVPHSEVSQAVMNTDSPTDVAMVVLTLFVLSPLIICGNALFLAAFRRYKRLRTPSNRLVASLALADMGVGLFLPLGIYFELTKGGVDSAVACLLPYCTLIGICGVSILSMAAIALDRYTSLARPLRYNNIMTKASVGRYVVLFWLYAAVVGSTPLAVHVLDGGDSAPAACSFELVVGRRVRLLLFGALFAPCALLIFLCYAYVYVVARSHANAIYSVELSVRQQLQHGASTSPCRNHRGKQPFQPRYGRTLALTVGLFFVLWTPLQACLLVDSLRRRPLALLALVAFLNSAINPWVYGFRNTDFRLAYQRILEDFCVKFGVAKKQRELGLPPSGASNVRLCISPNHVTMTTLLKPSLVPGDVSSSCGAALVCETVVVVAAPDVP